METTSNRILDVNGFVTVARNPITKEGVFPYLGRSIPGAPDPDKIYMVYRPASELCDPECVASFANLPITDDHPQVMFSENFGPDQHNLHGTSDQNVAFENGILWAGIRIFTKTLQGLINAGKKALSAGYRCRFEKSSGVWNGLAYDYVQRNIGGNHISLVKEGRSGPDIAVLDHNDLTPAFDSFDLALETETEKGTMDMADKDDKASTEGDAKDEDTKETDGDTGAKDNDDGKESKEEKAEMTLSEVSAVLAEILPVVKKIQDTLAGTQGDGAALDEDEKEDKEGKAMDAAEISKLDARLKKVEGRDPVKEALSQMRSRDDLVRQVTPLVGTFDAADKTLEEVEAYVCDKLDIKVDASARGAAISGAIAASKKVSTGAGFAMDASAVKKDGLLAKTLNKTA